MRISDWSSDVCSSDLEMFDDCLHLLRAVLRNDQYVVAVGHDDRVGYANDGDAPPFAGAKIIARRVDRDDVADADIAGFVLGAEIVQRRPAADVRPAGIDGHDDRSEEHTYELQALTRNP